MTTNNDIQVEAYNENAIIEGNKLIAEFMNIELSPASGWVYWNIGGFPKEKESPAQFHSSWDWLMPVVNKCYNLREDDRTIRTEEITFALVKCDIAKVWYEVVKFIQQLY